MQCRSQSTPCAAQGTRSRSSLLESSFTFTRSAGRSVSSTQRSVPRSVTSSAAPSSARSQEHCSASSTTRLFPCGGSGSFRPLAEASPYSFGASAWTSVWALFLLKEQFCAFFARSNLYSAKEKLKIVSVRGGAAHFAPPHPTPAFPRGGNTG